MRARVPAFRHSVAGLLAVFGGVCVVFAGDGFVSGEGFGSGVPETFAFAALPARGVGVGFAVVLVFAGTGTKITWPSGGMNWLGLFGSIV